MPSRQGAHKLFDLALEGKAAGGEKDGPRPSWQLRPGQHIDRYRLVSELGEGGFGMVWLAEQQEPIRREVALKLIKPGMDSRQVLERFANERQTLALMEHPNIAKVLDAGATAEGRPYVVMDLVRGAPITEYCDQRCLGVKERLALFVQVCSAVQHAHQKAVLHRDLKPSNILVETMDGRPVPKVIDFGIAKALGAEQPFGGADGALGTGVGQIIGTPEYMSPEQAGNGLDVDTRSDIYSLGAILYELLTGVPPVYASNFRRLPLDQMLRMVQEAQPAKPSARFGSALPLDRLRIAAARGHDDPRRYLLDLRSDLDWIVLKALEKDRGRRYETAMAFATDLERFLENKAVSARSPTRLYLLKKLFERNRFAFGAAGLILLMLIGGAAGLAMQNQELQVANRIAETKTKEALEAEKKEENARQDAVEKKNDAEKAELAAKQNEKEANDRLDFFTAVLAKTARSKNASETSELLRKISDAAEERRNAGLPQSPEMAYRLSLVLADNNRDIDSLDVAERFYRDALARLREIGRGETLDAANCLYWIAWTHHRRGERLKSGDIADEKQDVDECFTILQAAPEPESKAIQRAILCARALLVGVYRTEGHAEEARAELAALFQQAEATGLRESAGYFLALREKVLLDDAKASLQDALDTIDHLGSRLVFYGLAFYVPKENQKAMENQGANEDQVKQIGADLLWLEGQVYRKHGNLDEAANAAEQEGAAKLTWLDHGDPLVMAEQADLFFLRGNAVRATLLFRDAIELCRKYQLLPELETILRQVIQYGGEVKPEESPANFKERTELAMVIVEEKVQAQARREASEEAVIATLDEAVGILQAVDDARGAPEDRVELLSERAELTARAAILRELHDQPARDPNAAAPPSEAVAQIKKQLGAAIADLEELVKANPANYRAQFQIGVLALTLNDETRYAACLAALRPALSKETDFESLKWVWRTFLLRPELDASDLQRAIHLPAAYDDTSPERGEWVRLLQGMIDLRTGDHSHTAESWFTGLKKSSVPTITLQAQAFAELARARRAQAAQPADPEMLFEAEDLFRQSLISVHDLLVIRLLVGESQSAAARPPAEN